MKFFSFFEILSGKLKKDKDFKELIRGSAIYFVVKLLGIFVSYLFTLFVTRYYGASVWGLFALSLTVLQITSVIGRFGLDIALLRFIAEYKSQGRYGLAKLVYKKAVLFVFLLSLLLALGLYILAPIISKDIFNKTNLIDFIKNVAVILPAFTLLYLNTESLRALKKIGLYVVNQNVFPFSIALVFLLFITWLLNKNIYNVPISYLVAIYISCFLSFVFLYREFKKFSNGSKEKISLIKLLSISFPMLMANSLTLIMAWTDIIMLGIFRSEFEVGIYSVASKLSLLTSFTLAAINSIAAPKFAEFWGKGDIKGLAKTAQQATKLILISSLPILLMFSLFPNTILSIFGEGFSKASGALIILTLGQFINAAAGSVGNILLMTGRQKIFQNFLLIGIVINIVLNLILIPHLGIIGAAMATAISLAFWNIAALIYIRKVYGFWTISIK